MRLSVMTINFLFLSLVGADSRDCEKKESVSSSDPLFWDYEDDNEWSEAVDGWHFRVKKGTNRFYACSECDKSEIRTTLVQSIIGFSRSKDDVLTLELQDGKKIELKTKEYLFGIPQEERSNPLKTNQEYVQGALVDYENRPIDPYVTWTLKQNSLVLSKKPAEEK